MKKILIAVSVLIIGLAVSIGFGLYLMEIDDHYGDLQELYFESRSGDLIVDMENAEFGVLTKNWRRINVITKGDTSDLFNWVNRKDKPSSVVIFKTYDKDIEFSAMTFEQVDNMIERSELIFVTSN